MDDFVAHAPGRDFVRPTDNKRRSQRAFHVREIITAPWPGRSLRRQLIDPRRGRAAGYAAAVTTHFAVAEIVHQDEDDVRFVRRSLGGGGLLWLGRLRGYRHDHERKKKRNQRRAYRSAGILPAF